MKEFKHARFWLLIDGIWLGIAYEVLLAKSHPVAWYWAILYVVVTLYVIGDTVRWWRKLEEDREGRK